MVAFDGIGDVGQACFVEGPSMLLERVVRAESDGLVDFGVGVGLVLALVPAETSVGADGGGELLLEVEADAVLYGRAGGVGGDVGERVEAGLEGLDGVAVEAHVGVVDVAEEADGGVAVGAEEVGPELKLGVFASGAADVPVEVDSVGLGGHEGEGVAGGEDGGIVLGYCGVGVASGVGGVVPGSVVVDGPVHELKVGVGAYGVEVEDVGNAHFAEAQVEAVGGDPGSEGVGGAFGVGLGVCRRAAEADGLVELDAGEVGLGAEAGISDYVEVGEAG